MTTEYPTQQDIDRAYEDFEYAINEFLCSIADALVESFDNDHEYYNEVMFYSLKHWDHNGRVL